VYHSRSGFGENSVKIKGYSYYKNGKKVTVKGFTRKGRKKAKRGKRKSRK